MSANTSPVFTLTPILAAVRLTTANTARDGSGTLTQILAGATNGTRVDRVKVTANVTTTAGMIRFWLDDGTGTYKLLNEVPVTAITPSGSAVAWTGEWVRTDGLPIMVLPSGFNLKATTNNSEQCDIIAYGGNY